MGDETLEDVARAAAAAWTDEIAIEQHVFEEYLVARVPADADADAIARLHVADLYLACACVHGDPRALAVFEATRMRDVRDAIARLRVQASAVDDLCQMTREKLLVGTPERPARLAEYAGRGALRGWVRVVATRLALNALRDQKPERPLDEALVAASAEGAASPELAYLRERHGAQLDTALARAMDALTPPERVLLRQRFVDGLSTEQIAKLYRVHRITILRRLEAVLRAIRTRTKQSLERDFGCAPSVATSVVNLVLSQTHLSVGRYLGPAQG